MMIPRYFQASGQRDVKRSDFYLEVCVYMCVLCVMCSMICNVLADGSA